MNSFEQRFGRPSKDVVVCFGNWHETKHYRGHKQEGWRRAVSLWYKLLMRRGYKVALVDEHFTSMRCSSCKLLASVFTY